MIEYKFLVAQNDIKGMPGLYRGDAVIRERMEIMDGGYEYDVWRVMCGAGPTARTRIEHRGEFSEFMVDGKDMDEVMEKILAASDGIRKVED